ncbi:ARF/SAR superfamily, partial [Paramicrosporidium saccamoebae]
MGIPTNWRDKCDHSKPYWRCYYANTDGIVFVVDSADVDRTVSARSELSSMLQEDELRNAPLLDLPGAMQMAELSESLDLVSIKERPWHIQCTTATEGTGLEDGFG